MACAEVVKKIRSTLYLERSEFAALLGISPQAIWQYETGLRRPRLKTIKLLLVQAKNAKIKVSIEDFLE